MLFCFQDTIRAMDAKEVKQNAVGSNFKPCCHFTFCSGTKAGAFCIVHHSLVCVCGICRQLERPKMSFCCGYVSCLAQKPEFRNLCMRHNVIVASILNRAHKTNFLAFCLIVRGFHGACAAGAACRQRTLTPPDTWSCPTLGLACVLMSRPISPELVLSPDF